MKALKLLLLLALAAVPVALDRRFGLVDRAFGYVTGLSAMPAPNAANALAASVPPPLRKVRVVQPKPAAPRFTLTLPGRTAPAEQARLSSRVAGVVAERRGEIGDRVKAGDVLVEIDAPEIRQQLERAAAAVKQVEARLALAELNLERAEDLAPKKIITAQTRDERVAGVAATKADLEAARAEVRRLEEVRGFMTIRAPFDGTILQRQVERGDRVNGDAGAASVYLYAVARLEELRVEVAVPQSLAMKIKPGTAARMAFAEIPGQAFAAKVVRSSQSVDAASSTMRVELALANADLKIPAGLNGQVLFDVERDAACVLVPGNVLVVTQGVQMVATVDSENKISYRPVGLGRDLGNEVEICSGLSEGERVILSPNALLKSGDRVELITPPPAK